VLALDRARVSDRVSDRASDRVSDRFSDRRLTECPNQTESSKFAHKPSNPTQLKQIQLDSLSLGHYVYPRHEARSHLGPTECQH
jgi:hypothetical protein